MQKCDRRGSGLPAFVSDDAVVRRQRIRGSLAVVGLAGVEWPVWIGVG